MAVPMSRAMSMGVSMPLVGHELDLSSKRVGRVVARSHLDLSGLLGVLVVHQGLALFPGAGDQDVSHGLDVIGLRAGRRRKSAGFEMIKEREENKNVPQQCH